MNRSHRKWGERHVKMLRTSTNDLSRKIQDLIHFLSTEIVVLLFIHS